MFFLELEPQDSNKDIYKLERLYYSKVLVEPVRQNRTIPQCANCLRLGHTKKYCTRKQRCIKCSEYHDNKNCKKTSREELKCALCEGKHPANYKGCEVYKKLQQQKFPTLRPTTQINNRKVDGKLTYAAAAQNPETNEETVPMPAHSSKESELEQRINKMENLMTKMIERMDTMMSIVTKLLNKLD